MNKEIYEAILDQAYNQDVNTSEEWNANVQKMLEEASKRESETLEKYRLGGQVVE